MVGHLAWCRTLPREETPFFVAPSMRQIKDIIEPTVQRLTGGNADFRYGSANEASIEGRRHILYSAENARSFKNIRGPNLPGGLCEEGTLCEEESITELLNRMRSVPNPHFSLSTNPDGPTHWIKEQLVDTAGDGDHVAIQLRLQDNPGLSLKYKQDLRKRLHGVWLRRGYYGEWAAAAGLIYQSVEYGEPPPLEDVHTWSLTVDYAAASVTHALLVGEWVEPRERWVYDEWRWNHADAGSLTEDEQVEHIMLDLGMEGDLPRPLKRIYVDPSAAGLAAAFRKRIGIPGVVVPADNRVESGLQQTGVALHRRWIRISDSCVLLKRDMEGYVWDPKAAKLGLTRPLKLADHGPDALRYYVATEARDMPWLLMAA